MTTDRDNLFNDQPIAIDVAVAMEAARRAFEDTIHQAGYDPAHWDIRITVWEKDASFTTRLRRYEIEEECK